MAKIKLECVQCGKATKMEYNETGGVIRVHPCPCTIQPATIRVAESTIIIGED